MDDRITEHVNKFASDLEAAIAEGVIVFNDQDYMEDPKGKLVPRETVKPQHVLEDELVRKIIFFARDLSEQISGFRGHTSTNLGEFDALLAQQYDAKKGGAKGNRTYMSYDGRLKVQVQIADHVDFGPELQIAKTLIDECLNEWAAESGPELRAIVTRAFNTDKEGQINRSEIFMLLRQDITDPRWIKAMDAVRDAMRVTGSKTYIRFYEREARDAPWQAITIDLSKT